ncbi:MAG: hypothetical protein NC823_00080 [Candidatus Omnitrophica bacterium]|nr:hypothetical protein [Candidatus Omnitrophota bacterium]
MERKKEEKALGTLVDCLKESLGGKLVSVIVYGSFLTENYQPGISDINLIVVVSQVTAGELFSLRKKIKRLIWKHGFKPFFFTPEFVKSSLDTFPLEWVEIKNCHRVIYGENLVEKLLIDREDLRRQLERQIKQDYLDFQQGLFFGENPLEVIKDSLKSWKVIARHLSEIGLEIIENPPALPVRPSGQELTECAEEHLGFLRKLVKLIDQGSHKQ